MKKIYYSVIIILLLQIFTACGPGSPPTINDDSSYSINILVDPAEGGTVLPESRELAEGDSIEISASPNEGWVFNSWQGDHTGNINPDTVFMDDDKEITALFVERDYPLTVNIEGDGTVEERIVQPKTTDYPNGTVVELTAEPSDGWSFVEWTGEQSNEENPIQIEINNEVEITAHFDKEFYTLNVEVEGNGSVEEVLQTGNESDGTYEFDSIVELIASADVGWGFSGWEGDLQGDLNPNTITIDADKEVKAVFVQSNSDFAGGSGTEVDPYRISTIDHLQNIDDEKYIDKHFIQINNVNAISTSNWYRGNGFEPIGNEESPFSGTYDGDGYEISRLTINREDDDNVGLFGFVENGIIKNTWVRNANILGDEIVGGLVGTNNGQIINSEFYGRITGEENVGGLVGFNNGRIENSYAIADVSGEEGVGGLVGQNHAEIAYSYSGGSVSGDDEGTGGLVGFNSGLISNTYSHSEVEGDEETGGLVGENRSNGRIEFSYSAGPVSGDDHTGGFIGTNRADINSGYWDINETDQREGTGRGSSSGATGLRTSEMQGSSAINNMPEFDWDEIWRVTSDYPVFRWQEQ